MVLKARQCSLNGFPRAVSDHEIDVRFVFQTKSKVLACARRWYFGIHNLCEFRKKTKSQFFLNKKKSGTISSDDWRDSFRYQSIKLYFSIACLLGEFIFLRFIHRKIELCCKHNEFLDILFLKYWLCFSSMQGVCYVLTQPPLVNLCQL